MRKGKFLKQFWFSPSVIEALTFCRKERNFRSNREYIERLILEDQERIKRPPKDSVTALNFFFTCLNEYADSLRLRMRLLT